MSLTLVESRSSIRANAPDSRRFYSNLDGLNRVIRSQEYLAALTHEPRPVHIAVACREERTTSGDRVMPPGKTDRRAETSAVASTSTPVDDPRVYLAAERTFLAWVRTSVSLMGFGFVIARFALWTREYGFSGTLKSQARPGVSTWLGFGMVSVGVFVCVLAAARHRGYVNALERGVANPPLSIKTSLIVAGTLAVVGMAIAIHILML
jgi:putative membrane protein